MNFELNRVPIPHPAGRVRTERLHVTSLGDSLCLSRLKLISQSCDPQSPTANTGQHAPRYWLISM